MMFSTKTELISLVQSISIDDKNKVNDIVNHLYYMKRTGKLCKYNLSNDEINMLEDKLKIYLKDYHDYEKNINQELQNLNNNPNRMKFFEIIYYITECGDYFDGKYDVNLVNSIRSKLLNN